MWVFRIGFCWLNHVEYFLVREYRRLVLSDTYPFSPSVALTFVGALPPFVNFLVPWFVFVFFFRSTLISPLVLRAEIWEDPLLYCMLNTRLEC